MLQGEKEKLVCLVNKREKKKLVVRGMATLVPLPHFVVFAELVGWYGTVPTRRSAAVAAAACDPRNGYMVQSRKMQFIAYSRGKWSCC